MACGIYICIAIELLKGHQLQDAYQEGIKLAEQYIYYQGYPYILEVHHFERVLNGNIALLPVEEINSEGYVIDTLEASLWCLLTTSSYVEAV